MITENQLDAWVRANAREAQGIIVELIYRLVSASSPKPKDRHFPLGDSAGQPGPDGVLDTDFGFNPFIPEGKSFWEIGVGINAGSKATSDYRDLTDATPEEVRQESIFIFVTPLSGWRDWQYTWKEDAKIAWIEKRRKLNEWKNVCVIDGTCLIDWVKHFPPIEQWLARKMGIPTDQMETLEQRWACLKEIGSPPPLISDVFLANRNEACDKLKNVFDGTTIQLKLETHFPHQVADFIAAYVENMDREGKTDVVGRCLIISSAECWKTLTDAREQHFLVANFDLDDDAGTKLLEKARRARHAVIYPGSPRAYRKKRGSDRSKSSALTILFRVDVESECIIISSPDIDPWHQGYLLVLGQSYRVIPVVHCDNASSRINACDCHIVEPTICLNLCWCVGDLPDSIY
jgi:hypothetical protein